MTRFIRTLTPALALVATLALGAAHAQTNTPASSAAPAVTGKSETSPAVTPQKKHGSATRHKADTPAKQAKKASDSVTAQTGKATTPATPAPKS